MNLRAVYLFLATILSILGFLWMVACDLFIYLSFSVTPIMHHQPQREQLDNIPSIEVCYTVEEALLTETPLQKAWDSFPSSTDVLDNDKTQINGFSSGVNEVKKLLKDNLMCYDITLTQHVINKRNLTGIPIMARIFLKPGLNKNKDSMMYVSMHSRYTGPTTRTMSFIQSPRGTGEGNEGSWLTVSYSRSIFQLLTSPYTTDCIQYHSIGFKGQDDCYNRCLINQKINSTSTIPFEAIVEDESILSSVRLQRNGTSLGQEGIHCRNQCNHRDCISDIITPRLISAVPSSTDQIDIVFPTEPELMTSYVPFCTFEMLFRNFVRTAVICFFISPLPFVFFERTVHTLATEVVTNVKNKRNGITPQDSVCNASTNGARAANGVNIINSFANNNVQNGA